MTVQPAVEALLEFNEEELAARLADLGEPAYRARQVWRWLYQGLAQSYDEMTDVPARLRTALAERWPIAPLIRVDSADAADEATKVLLQARDGRIVEAVLMRYPQRTTLCLSSQLGCAVGCVFCQTGLSGFERQLSVGEMVGQYVHLARAARDEGREVTNVVLMGMGEPLLNFDVLVEFLRRATAANGLALGARHVTVSTAGVAPKIRELAEQPWQVNLAVSLHAADDELRSRLVPLNRRYPLAELMAACRDYAATTHRRISFEWTLIDQVNDSPGQARALAALVRGLLCHVNLIPLNPIDSAMKEPSPMRVAAFKAALEKAGIPVSVRYSRGRRIAAACGQLRARRADPAAVVA